ncbi:MAG: tRNA threonylcarbamoyladenosine dehydratase [Oscillospiraceae bacterium]|nr:tRNA threonylcarbamoyladenosine dehydratase [Oscillospiraceae bacterium]
MTQFSRTAMLFGQMNMERLAASRVAVFGLGGVGGHCAEALARSGIGAIDLFDGDRVCLSNLNRQLVAAMSTIGRYKAEVMRERILDINPNAKVGVYNLFYLPDTADTVDLSVYGCVADAVDTVTAKLELVCRAASLSVPIISCMGAANRLNASAFEVTDIFKTSNCPLARVMRNELNKRDIASLRVVCSKEPPVEPVGEPEEQGRRVLASNAFVPPAAGLVMAGEVVRILLSGAPSAQNGGGG